MSLPFPESFPESISEAELIHRMHDRILEIIHIAKEEDSELLDFEVDEEEGEVNINFYITGRQDERPILVTDIRGNLNYITATINISEEFDDIEALGRDADGNPAAVMQLDKMAELKNRTLQVLIDTHDSPGWQWDYNKNQHPGHEKGWLIGYDIDKGWSIRFWKDNADPTFTRDRLPGMSPEIADVDQLSVVLDEAETQTRS